MHHSNLILRKIFLPVGTSSLIAASVVSKTEGKDDKEKTLIRPRDLSLYKKPAEQSKSESAAEEESVLNSVVRQAREAIWSVSNELTQVTDKFNHILETGKAHTSSSIQILRDEGNYAQRYGAIAAGGLVGFVVAIRRGWFKRIIYTGSGAAAVAAVCYPEEASKYSSQALQETKHFIVVAYHFINGVTRDYVGVQLPSLPGPLNMSGGGGGATPSSAALMPPPASGPSHISVPPSPPIDVPVSILGSQKKGRDDLSSVSDNSADPEPKPVSNSMTDPSLANHQFMAEKDESLSIFL